MGVQKNNLLYAAKEKTTMSKPMVVRAKEAIRLLRGAEVNVKSLKRIHRTVADYEDAISIAISALKHMMMTQCDKPFSEKELKRQVNRPVWIRFLENGKSTESCPNGRWTIIDEVDMKNGIVVTHLGDLKIANMTKTWQMFSGYVPKGASLSVYKNTKTKQSACILPSDIEWDFDCEVLDEHRAMTVQIGFSHSEFEGDETEFCVETQDFKAEFDTLFDEFCKENNLKNVRIEYVTVVRSAIDMDALIKMEEEM